MSRLIGILAVAIACAALTVWLAAQGAFGAWHWLDNANPEAVRLLANWGWLGAAFAAIPVMLRSRRKSNDA